MQVNVNTKAVLLMASIAGLAGGAIAGGPFPSGLQIGPDITLCQLYGLAVSGRSGTYPNGMSGGSVATTSWNIGTVNAEWFQSPNPNHPKIAMDLFRKRTFTVNGVQIDRLEQIGQSWCKHGFFALSNQQCGTHPFAGQVAPQYPGGIPANCQGTNGQWLGVGCTDTYSTSLNATQNGLGPRFEINPWTAAWVSTGSLLGGGNPGGVVRRLQFRDQDIIAPGGETYNLYIQGYYVTWDDIDVFTSAGWKPITSYTWTGTNWNFVMSGATTDEVMGFAYDAWTGARQTLVAQEFPVIEKWTADFDGPGGLQESPDGRAMVLCKVFDLGNGTWRYEYAVYNIDMDRQIGSFTVPVDSSVTVTDIGWSGVFHHGEPTNKTVANGGKAINNNAWPGVRNSNDVTWATNPYTPTGTPSNPLRWGTMYNFWFTANSEPNDDVVTLGLFTPGTPSTLDARSSIPSVVPPPICLGDADGDGDRDFNDLTTILSNWGNSYTPGAGGPGDSNLDGTVDFGDVTTTLGLFGLPC